MPLLAPVTKARWPANMPALSFDAVFIWVILLVQAAAASAADY
jgi:hypothetical protein